MKILKSSIFIFLLVLFTLQGAFSQTISEQQQKEIQAYLKNQVSGQVPGLAAGVVRNGEVVFEAYHGYASLQHYVKVSDSTRFNIASVAKQFTALCVLNLALEKKLSLDDDVRDYVPELFPGLEEELKIKYLLNHSSGIRDFYDLMSLQQNPWWRAEGLDNDDAMDLLKKQRELNFTPNSAHLYSNSNYTILTRVVEKVSGQSFHQYSEELFQKLGMSETYFLKNYMHVIPNQALPYSDWGNGIWQEYPMITNLYGDGFLFTTLKDQLHYEELLQNATGTDQLLIQSQQPIPGTKIQTYGFGLEFNDQNGFPSVNHSGSTGSYHARTLRFPAEKLSIVVMSNNGNLWSGFIASKIASILLPEKPVSEPSDYFPDTENTHISQGELVGEYLSPEGAIIRIQEDESGKLFWKQDNNNPQELVKIHVSLYEWKANEKLKMHFTRKDGMIESFTVYYPGSPERVHKKLPAFAFTDRYLDQFAGKYYSEELEFGFEVEVNNGQLTFRRENSEKLLTLENIQRDQFLLSDYIITVRRNPEENVTALLVTTNRIKDVRFKKIE